MLTLQLQRKAFSEQGTPGFLTGPDFDFHTLELPWRDLDGNGVGDQQRSCINAGEYLCEFAPSHHFGEIYPELEPRGMCYHVRDVPGREHILMHNANFAGDVDLGWQSQLLGCIALGMRPGVLPNKYGRQQMAVLQSKLAIKKFHEAMAGEPFRLIIENPK